MQTEIERNMAAETAEPAVISCLGCFQKKEYVFS